VPGHRVQRLDLAAKAFAGAGVEQRTGPAAPAALSASMVGMAGAADAG
jgi:hypothetical protein